MNKKYDRIYFYETCVGEYAIDIYVKENENSWHINCGGGLWKSSRSPGFGVCCDIGKNECSVNDFDKFLMKTIDILSFMKREFDIDCRSVLCEVWEYIRD